MPSLDQLINLLLFYKYALLLPASIVEGPIVTIIAGFLAAQGQMSLFGGFTVVIAGDFIGDTFYYFIGRWGRDPRVRRARHLLGLTDERIDLFEAHFLRHATKSLLAGKLSHGAGTLVLVAAGVARMPYGRFIALNMLATIPKSLILILVGYYFGAAYSAVAAYLDYIAIGTLVMAVVLVLMYALVKKGAKRLDRDLPNP